MFDLRATAVRRSRRRILSQTTGAINLQGHRERFASLNDDSGVRLCDEFERMLLSRAEIVAEERDRLARLVRRDQGTHGPSDWGRGYYDACEDVLDLLQKGV